MIQLGIGPLKPIAVKKMLLLPRQSIYCDPWPIQEYGSTKLLGALLLVVADRTVQAGPN